MNKASKRVETDDVDFILNTILERYADCFRIEKYHRKTLLGEINQYNNGMIHIVHQGYIRLLNITKTPGRSERLRKLNKNNVNNNENQTGERQFDRPVRRTRMVGLRASGMLLENLNFFGRFLAQATEGQCVGFQNYIFNGSENELNEVTEKYPKYQKSAKISTARSGIVAENWTDNPAKGRIKYKDLYSFESDTIPVVCIADGDTEVWSIGTDALFSMLPSCSDLSAALFHLIGRQCALESRWCGRLAALDVPSRLAATLLDLGEFYGEAKNERGWQLIDFVSQQDIADLIGASRSFVSSLINTLKRDGCVVGEGRRLALADRDRLLALAEGEVYVKFMTQQPDKNWQREGREKEKTEMGGDDQLMGVLGMSPSFARSGDIRRPRLVEQQERRMK